MSQVDFDALLTPTTREQFFSEYWETKPLRISRKQSAYYSDLFSASDIDYMLSAACLLDREGVQLLGGPDEARVGAAKKPLAALYQAYRQGASLRIRGINRYSKPLWTLCLQMQELFGFQVAANLYCTPTNSHGLEKHFDYHDTMVMQIAGSKNWSVFGSAFELPLEHAPLLQFEKPAAGVQYRGAPVMTEFVEKYGNAEPTDQFVLEPGDFLYLPRGVVHQAWATGDLSAHVTIGIYPITWVDLITVALGQLGHQDVRFRKSIPSGLNRSAAGLTEETFKTLVHEIAKLADVSKAVEEINGSLIWNEQAIGEGLITKTESQDIDVKTLVERRPGQMCNLVIDGAFVRLTASHTNFSMPRQFEPALKFVSENQHFIVGALPGRLSEQSKITLVRRLIDDGFLRTANNSLGESGNGAKSG